MKRLLFTLAVCSSLLTAAGAEDRPNIIFLFSDDHACNAISAYPGGLFDEIADHPGALSTEAELMRSPTANG